MATPNSPMPGTTQWTERKWTEEVMRICALRGHIPERALVRRLYNEARAYGEHQEMGVNKWLSSCLVVMEQLGAELDPAAISAFTAPARLTDRAKGKAEWYESKHRTQFRMPGSGTNSTPRKPKK